MSCLAVLFHKTFRFDTLDGAISCRRPLRRPFTMVNCQDESFHRVQGELLLYYEVTARRYTLFKGLRDVGEYISLVNVLENVIHHDACISSGRRKIPVHPFVLAKPTSYVRYVWTCFYSWAP